jgi:hypothetical protein
MSDFKQGDRVIVLRLDTDEVECHGRYEGQTGPIMFVLPDDEDLPDPIEVGADRVLPEKRRSANLAARRPSASAVVAVLTPLYVVNSRNSYPDRAGILG